MVDRYRLKNSIGAPSMCHAANKIQKTLNSSKFDSSKAIAEGFFFNCFIYGDFLTIIWNIQSNANTPGLYLNRNTQLPVSIPVLFTI